MDPFHSNTDRKQSISQDDHALPPRSEVSQIAAGAQTSDANQLINGYRIIGRLWSGGMGTVWRAVQLSTHRKVALKVLHASLRTTQQGRLRFEREVEIAGALEHEHIARLYDSGVCQDTYFYAMELIEGLALDEYAEHRRLDQRGRLALLSAVCRAIQYAHQKGVIHRDLKPSNIIVDEKGKPHIVDFGLGKSLIAQAPDKTISIQGEWA